MNILDYQTETDAGDAAPPGDVDPLVQCLEHVSAWHGAEVSREALLAGMPVTESGRVPLRIFDRIAQRAGYRTQIVKRKLEDLSKSVLPAIVLLKRNRAGVLLPGDREGPVEFAPAEDLTSPWPGLPVHLRKEYSGYTILLRPASTSANAASTLPAGLETPKGRARWFWSTLWKFRGDYMRLLPASFLVNFFAFAMPLFTMLVYNRVVPNNAEETLWVLSSGVALIFGFEYVLRLLRGYVLKDSGREMDMVLASNLFDQIVSLQLRSRPASSGSLAGRAKSYEILRDFFVSAAVLALADVPFAILMTSAVFLLGGPIMGWLLAGAIVATIGFQCLIQPSLRRSVVNSAEAGLERQALVSETINGLETLKSCNAEGALVRRFENMVADSSRKDVSAHWYSLLGDSTTKGIINVTSVAVVVVSVYEIQSGLMSMGGMIACVMLAGRIMTPLAMAAGLMTRLQQTLHALRGLNAMMAMPREVEDSRKCIQRHAFAPAYQFNHVSVTYPDQIVPAVADLTLSIREGERIALLGRMGSGKSTLLRLMARLYEPTEGEIILDGIALNQYHPAAVRAQVGYLPQNASIFCGTLRENITLGARGISDEAIMDAVRMVGLDDFVLRHPLGLFAPVGEQGALLSGGQRQALGLARVLLRRPKMLLLDEPTSSLDLQSEQQFIACLKRYLGEDPQRSLVVATHKTNILELVRRVIVLHEGNVHRDTPVGAVMESLTKNGTSRPAKTSKPAAAAAAVAVA